MNNKTNYTFKNAAMYRGVLKNKKNSRFLKYNQNKKIQIINTVDTLENNLPKDTKLSVINENNTLENNSFINKEYINTHISELFAEYNKQLDIKIFENIKKELNLFISNFKGVQGDKGPEGDKGQQGDKGPEGDKGSS